MMKRNVIRRQRELLQLERKRELIQLISLARTRLEEEIKPWVKELTEITVQQPPALIEREVLHHVLSQNAWVQAKAARALHLTARQIYYAMKKHGLTVPDEKRKDSTA